MTTESLMTSREQQVIECYDDRQVDGVTGIAETINERGHYTVMYIFEWLENNRYTLSLLSLSLLTLSFVFHYYPTEKACV